MRRLLTIALLAFVPTLVACGDDDDKSCSPITNEGCKDGLVCELVLDGEPACFARFAVQGRVFDGLDDSGIGGATVVGLDANGGARTATVKTASDGSYSLPVAVQRDKEGNPLTDEKITLRVAASDYQPFPQAPRLALPIDLTAFVEQDKTWVVANAATDVALFALEGDTSGLVTIEGHVDADDAGGVLVVAVQGSTAVSSTVTGSGGSFTLFNVPAGETSVEGYRAGLNVTPASVTVGAEAVKDVVLTGSSSGLATVSGSVNIVNAEGGLLTSVLLVLESTFDETQKRGEAPAGLRVGDVSGAFSIPDVPPGKYVVLAAFENDRLVRDPDESIGGTQIQHIEVSGSDVEMSASFKITEALAVVSPGAEGIDTISDAEPTFVWADDSSESGYELRVYDALGELVHEALDIPSVSGSDTVSYTWSGAQLVDGMIYQFRVVSWKDDKGSRSYISATEDLLGTFHYAVASN